VLTFAHGNIMSSTTSATYHRRSMHVLENSKHWEHSSPRSLHALSLHKHTSGSGPQCNRVLLHHLLRRTIVRKALSEAVPCSVRMHVSVTFLYRNGECLQNPEAPRLSPLTTPECSLSQPRRRFTCLC